MRLSLALVGFLLSIGDIECKKSTISLTDDTGDIVSYPAASKAYKILAEKRHKIVLQITDLQLNKRSYLKVKGPGIASYTYKMSNGRILKREKGRSKGSRRSTKVDLPIQIESENRVLKLFHKVVNGNSREGFTAHYAGYSAEGKCVKKDLGHLFENATSWDCDSDELIPVSTRCNVTVDCGSQYTQDSKRMDCLQERWIGSIQCQLRKDLLQLCDYDFDTFAESENCPYDVKQVAEYHQRMLTTEISSISLSRSPVSRKNGRTISCKSICAHDRSGKFAKQCTKKNSWEYVTCLICRIKFKCRFGTVPF